MAIIELQQQIQNMYRMIDNTSVRYHGKRKFYSTFLIPTTINSTTIHVLVFNDATNRQQTQERKCYRVSKQQQRLFHC